MSWSWFSFEVKNHFCLRATVNLSDRVVRVHHTCVDVQWQAFDHFGGNINGTHAGQLQLVLCNWNLWEQSELCDHINLQQTCKVSIQQIDCLWECSNWALLLLANLICILKVLTKKLNSHFKHPLDHLIPHPWLDLALLREETFIVSLRVCRALEQIGKEILMSLNIRIEQRSRQNQLLLWVRGGTHFVTRNFSDRFSSPSFFGQKNPRLLYPWGLDAYSCVCVHQKKKFQRFTRRLPKKSSYPESKWRVGWRNLHHYCLWSKVLVTFYIKHWPTHVLLYTIGKGSNGEIEQKKQDLSWKCWNGQKCTDSLSVDRHSGANRVGEKRRGHALARDALELG